MSRKSDKPLLEAKFYADLLKEKDTDADAVDPHAGEAGRAVLLQSDSGLLPVQNSKGKRKVGDRKTSASKRARANEINNPKDSSSNSSGGETGDEGREWEINPDTHKVGHDKIPNLVDAIDLVSEDEPCDRNGEDDPPIPSSSRGHGARGPQKGHERFRRRKEPLALGSASMVNERTQFFSNFVIAWRSDKSCYTARCHLHTYQTEQYNGPTKYFRCSRTITVKAETQQLHDVAVKRLKSWCAEGQFSHLRFPLQKRPSFELVGNNLLHLPFENFTSKFYTMQVPPLDP